MYYFRKRTLVVFNMVIFFIGTYIIVYNYQCPCHLNFCDWLKLVTNLSYFTQNLTYSQDANFSITLTREIETVCFLCKKVKFLFSRL